MCRLHIYAQSYSRNVEVLPEALENTELVVEHAVSHVLLELFGEAEVYDVAIQFYSDSRAGLKHCSIEISAYLCNLEHLVDWSSIVIAVKKGSAEKASVGATARSTIRFLGRWFDMTFEIVEYEPGRFLTIKSTSGIAPCLFCYQFEAV